jgi:hypothetical protein
MGAVGAVLEQTRGARCDHAIQVHFRWIETNWDAAQNGATGKHTTTSA